MKRTEYPRPQFVRREWQCLNGSWEFAFDDETGRRQITGSLIPSGRRDALKCPSVLKAN